MQYIALRTLDFVKEPAGTFTLPGPSTEASAQASAARRGRSDNRGFRPARPDGYVPGT
jgi:hypothetical protein